MFLHGKFHKYRQFFSKIFTWFNTLSQPCTKLYGVSLGFVLWKELRKWKRSEGKNIKSVHFRFVHFPFNFCFFYTSLMLLPILAFKCLMINTLTFLFNVSIIPCMFSLNFNLFTCVFLYHMHSVLHISNHNLVYQLLMYSISSMFCIHFLIISGARLSLALVFLGTPTYSRKYLPWHCEPFLFLYSAYVHFHSVVWLVIGFHCSNI